MSNETWHIEPTRKYSHRLVELGPSIIYNALDVDMTKYNNKNSFRSKRFVINEDEESSSFCGLNKNDKRKKMKEETSGMHNLMPSIKQLQRSQKVGTGHK